MSIPTITTASLTECELGHFKRPFYKAGLLSLCEPTHSAAEAQTNSVQIALAKRQAVLRVSTELLRTAVVAHQRRGDSDAVAHCFNQLLALDLTDPAWDAVLASGAS